MTPPPERATAEKVIAEAGLIAGTRRSNGDWPIADVIDRLADIASSALAEVDRLTEALKRWQDDYYRMDRIATAERERAETAEAALKLRDEALRWFDETYDYIDVAPQHVRDATAEMADRVVAAAGARRDGGG